MYRPPVRMVLQGWFKTPSSRKSCTICFTTVCQPLFLVTAGQFQKRARIPKDSKLLKIWWEINAKKGDYNRCMCWKKTPTGDLCHYKSYLAVQHQRCFWLDVADTAYFLVQVLTGSTVRSWGYHRVGGTQAEKDTRLAISTSSGHKHFGFACLTITCFSTGKWQCMYVCMYVCSQVLHVWAKTQTRKACLE